MELKRDELADKYSKTLAAIASIEESTDVFLYATKDKYLPNIGHIHEIENIEGLIKAQTAVNKSRQQQTDAVVAQLGITADELSKKTDAKLMGLKLSYWDADIKTRLTELRKNIRLAKLQKDAAILRKNLNEDDNFKLDMLELSGETV